MNKTIKILTLGCPKNLVDSEKLSYKLNNYKIVHTNKVSQAEILIINTCGFIVDAKKESISTILKAIDLKNKSKIKKIYVIGCFVQNNKKILKQELPEIDGFFEIGEYNKLIKEINPKSFPLKNKYGRIFYNTNPATAYIKIADGCNRKCSFCIIPNIKGKYHSETITNIINEAKYLTENNVKEIILIAQDTTYYGYDLYKKPMLNILLNELEKIDKIKWIRILYAYPQFITKELLNTIKQSSKVCKYIDLPIQHISDKMLKLMRRNISANKLKETLYKIKNTIPNIVIRTTVIVGHPYETKKDFNELLNFIKEFKFDKLGVFKYSHEEGSYAFNHYKNNVAENIKNERYHAIMELQQEISREKLKKFIGTIQEVLVDEKKKNLCICRTQYDAPEIDGVVYIKNNNLKTGNFYNAYIINSYDYDLEAIVT
ncbi:MAG: 30S ribosomal protein S12 methylthiotransferase RimO [Bacteroidales bacterium]|nr:30S ribosomal protein S12 methylthiotransferase RimO [Bacteroidales bacterium]